MLILNYVVKIYMIVCSICDEYCIGV